MESAIMELELDEIEKVSGGDDTIPTYEELIALVKRVAKAAKGWGRTYEDALSLMIFGYGDLLSEADIEACVRSVYGL